MKKMKMMQRRRRRRLLPPPMRLELLRQRLFLVVVVKVLCCRHQHHSFASGFCCHHRHHHHHYHCYYGNVRRLDLLVSTATTTTKRRRTTGISPSTSAISLVSHGNQQHSGYGGGGGGKDGDGDGIEFRRGVGVLLTVPIAWGSYEPAVRLVYKIQPQIPPFLFSFIYYVIATVALTTLSSSASSLQKQKEKQVQQTTGDLEQQQQQQHMFVENMIDTTTFTKKTNDDIADRGGVELGTYLFVGNALQVIGLSEVASDRAAFELQLTTILVPIVQSILAKNLRMVDTRTWTACLIALGGVGLIGLDGGGSSSGSNISGNTELTTLLLSDPASMLSNISFAKGDFFIMVGALFYSFHCVRLEVYAQRTAPVQLASAKAKTETFLSALVLGTCILTAVLTSGVSGGSLSMMKENPFGSILELARSSGDNVLGYIRGINIQQNNIDDWVKVGAATAWTGLVTVAYTIAAQVCCAFIIHLVVDFDCFLSVARLQSRLVGGD